MHSQIRAWKWFVIIALWVTLAGCTSAPVQTDSASPAQHDPGSAAPREFPGHVVGYLPADAVPDSLAILPPPPQAGSAALALDQDTSRRSFALRDSARWHLATSDADLKFPHAAGTYSCAANAPITESDTPRLYQLLRRTLNDLGRTTAAAKNHYMRTRPFALNNEPLCTPQDRAHLLKSGSYPSGHTTAGWGWALILAEIVPDRADAILVRGRAFGESRIVCNAHWQSDVQQGFVLAATTVARLHAEPAFRTDLEAAKAELATVRAKGLKPQRDCAAEAAALALQ